MPAIARLRQFITFPRWYCAPKSAPAYRGRSRGTLGDSPNLSDTIMRCDNLISSISLALEA